MDSSGYKKITQLIRQSRGRFFWYSLKNPLKLSQFEQRLPVKSTSNKWMEWEMCHQNKKMWCEIIESHMSVIILEIIHLLHNFYFQIYVISTQKPAL